MHNSPFLQNMLQNSALSFLLSLKISLSQFFFFFFFCNLLFNRYKKMDPCITPLPNVTDIHAISGGALQKWPKRLMSTPPRITSDLIKGITVKTFHEDTQLWRKRVSHYHVVLKSLKTDKYRNIMDMNAGIGSFAAALVEFPVWVMNVVPFDAEKNTLGVVFERGLIGTYMNW